MNGKNYRWVYEKKSQRNGLQQRYDLLLKIHFSLSILLLLGLCVPTAVLQTYMAVKTLLPPPPPPTPCQLTGGGRERGAQVEGERERERGDAGGRPTCSPSSSPASIAPTPKHNKRKVGRDDPEKKVPPPPPPPTVGLGGGEMRALGVPPSSFADPGSMIRRRHEMTESTNKKNL